MKIVISILNANKNLLSGDKIKPCRYIGEKMSSVTISHKATKLTKYFLCVLRALVGYIGLQN